MLTDLTTMNSILPATSSVAAPVLAQFGGTKSYWVDLILVVVMFGIAVFVVARASRRY